MSIKTSARHNTAGEIKEAGAVIAAGATETLAESGGVSHTNQPEPTQEFRSGDPSFANGATETAPKPMDQPWPAGKALTAMTEQALAEAINAGCGEVESAVHTAYQHAANALTGALRTGALLGEVHRRGQNKGFGAWVTENCPKLPVSTAYRYKDLAKKFPHVRNGHEIVSLRQAYLAVGLIHEKAPEKEKKAPDLRVVPGPLGTDLTARVKSNREFLGAELGKVNPATLNDAQRQALVAEITTLIAELEKVREAMSQPTPVACSPKLANEKEAA